MVLEFSVFGILGFKVVSFYEKINFSILRFFEKNFEYVRYKIWIFLFEMVRRLYLYLDNINFFEEFYIKIL